MNNPHANHRSSIGITRLAYRLPAQLKTLPQLESENRLESRAALLSEFGFEQAYVLDKNEDLMSLLKATALEILPEAHDRVTDLLFVSGLEMPRAAHTGKRAVDFFRYPSAELQQLIDLPKTNAMALSQQGCSGFLSSIRLARVLLEASNDEQASVLCVAADRLPDQLPRDVMYNLMSDAAGAVLVSKQAEQNRIVQFHQETQAYYWDTPLRETELLAAYFPMAKRSIEQTLEKAGLTLDEIAWFVPHNVSLRSWKILAGLLGIPMEKIWTNNIARIGHTVSCDHVINLVDMEQAGALRKGDYLLLFTFGFGASWTCLILQH
jgi:3-oxoacyl-[acyl-carrier-protein] synthase-3